MVATETDGRKLRAAERREETRERLLAAAVAVFAEQGFQAGTTKAITQRAGVAEGLLFHYFPTKTDLLLAVLARDPLQPAVERLLAELGEQPVAEALPRMAREWLRVLRGQQPIGLVLLQAAHADPQIQAAIGASLQALTALLAGYFARHAATGELRAVAPEAAAHLLVQALCGLAFPCAALSATDCERLLEQQVDLLLRGLLRRE
ncbi:MAG TPA: helix-turn-helix domain-containing protein [Chloroflexota bacterium]|nr:helix-turn-helix domain-containing protein [Chloroflexota bacterium]